MKNTDLFTILQLGPIGNGEVVIKYNDQYVVGKMSSIEYRKSADSVDTFIIEGFVYDKLRS